MDTSNLCWLCDLKKIEAVKKPLCKGCYQETRKRGLLHIFPTIKNIELQKKTLLKKYGRNFIKDICDLKREYTLSMVGRKYNITRERVRQIYKELFNDEYVEALKHKRKIKMNAKAKWKEEYNKIDNVLERNMSKDDTNFCKNAVSNHLFYTKCKELGYKITVKRVKNFFYCKVNGLTISVKSCYAKHRMSSKQPTEYYKFMKSKLKVDLYAAYIPDKNEWYIVPDQAISYSCYIPNNNLHKYSHLKEAFHLLNKRRMLVVARDKDANLRH